MRVKALSQSEVMAEQLPRGAIKPSFERNDLLNLFLLSTFSIMYQKEKAHNPQCLKLYLHFLIKALGHHCLDLYDVLCTQAQASQLSK